MEIFYQEKAFHTRKKNKKNDLPTQKNFPVTPLLVVVLKLLLEQFGNPLYRGPAPFHRLTPNKRFEPVFSTVIMAVCSLFNRMLLLTDLIPVHYIPVLYCGQTMMIGCNHTSFEWTRAVRHIYGIIRHMQGLY